jgi:hypothetical protein
VGSSGPTTAMSFFFVSPDNRIMVVGYATKGDMFVPGKPRVWSERQIGVTAFPRNYQHFGGWQAIRRDTSEGGARGPGIRPRHVCDEFLGGVGTAVEVCGVYSRSDSEKARCGFLREMPIPATGLGNARAAHLPTMLLQSWRIVPDSAGPNTSPSIDGGAD